MIYMAYSTLHWRIVNIMARLFGLMAFGAAVAFAISAARYWANPHLADSIPSASGSAFGDAFGVMIFSLVVGVLFSIVDTFRPDLDRSAINARNAFWKADIDLFRIGSANSIPHLTS